MKMKKCFVTEINFCENYQHIFRKNYLNILKVLLLRTKIELNYKYKQDQFKKVSFF